MQRNRKFKNRAGIMGKKGRRAGKTGGDTTAGGKAATKPKQGPGKARRERSAALREIQARIDALIGKLDVDPCRGFCEASGMIRDTRVCLSPLESFGAAERYTTKLQSGGCANNEGKTGSQKEAT